MHEVVLFFLYYVNHSGTQKATLTTEIKWGGGFYAPGFWQKYESQDRQKLAKVIDLMNTAIWCNLGPTYLQPIFT